MKKFFKNKFKIRPNFILGKFASLHFYPVYKVSIRSDLN